MGEEHAGPGQAVLGCVVGAGVLQLNPGSGGKHRMWWMLKFKMWLKSCMGEGSRGLGGGGIHSENLPLKGRKSLYCIFIPLSDKKIRASKKRSLALFLGVSRFYPTPPTYD